VRSEVIWTQTRFAERPGPGLLSRRPGSGPRGFRAGSSRLCGLSRTSSSQEAFGLVFEMVEITRAHRL